MRNRARAWAILIAVFLLGSLLGAGGAFFWSRTHPGPGWAHPQGSPPPPRGHRRLPELLEMTPEQEARFGEIMKESRRQLDALQTEQQPRIEAVLAETNQKISSILDAAQQKKFADYLEDIKRWRSPDGRDRRFGPPPGPAHRTPRMPQGPAPGAAPGV